MRTIDVILDPSLSVGDRVSSATSSWSRIFLEPGPAVGGNLAVVETLNESEGVSDG